MTLRDLVSWERPSDMRRMMRNFFGDDSWPSRQFHLSFPAIDIAENDKSFKVKAEILGMTPENVDITIDEGYLTIQGEKKEETRTGEEKDNYLRREISYGAFSRTVVLPESADTDKAEASFKDGLLIVEVPKKAGALGKSRKLQINKTKDTTRH